jgi:hypothetical protein
MNTKYSLRGVLEPSYPFEKLVEDIAIDNIKIHIQDNILEAGYDTDLDETKARNIVDQMTKLWSLVHEIKIHIELNQKWELKPNDNKNIFIELHDEAKVQDFVRLNQATITGRARIIKPDLFDSSAFKNNLPLLKKSLTNAALQTALIYFHEEILDNDRPLYGAYKALEELCFAVVEKKN